VSPSFQPLSLAVRSSTAMPFGLSSPIVPAFGRRSNSESICVGSAAITWVTEPAISACPARMPDAIEELLRLEGPFIGIGRTVRNETEINGFAVHPGEKVFLSWTSANRDEAEFEDSESFRLDRTTNRHLAFGAGPHRCAGSNLARLNLRIALTEIVNRLEDLTLDVAESEVHFHSAFNRSPLGLPISFTPGPRLGSV